MTTLNFPENLLPPVAENLLKKYDFFELYPLDGGGNFITCEILGSKQDRLITESVLRDYALNEFGGLENLDFRRFERWRSIEKSCWLNRFYFIVPLARTAWLNYDADLARKIVKVMLAFHRNTPPPADLKAHWERVTRRMNEEYNSKSREEIAKDETDVEYIWYDMQPGQRLICFLYALWFLRKFAIFSANETEELITCLRLHARVLANQDAFQTPRLDNHQSLRASALCWALPLLEDDPDYKEVQERTINLCNWHVMNEFRTDGTLYENSPSYHMFVLWHLRDYIALAKRRKWSIPSEVAKRFEASCRALNHYCRPDGTLLTVNDGFPCDCSAFQASLGGNSHTTDFAVLPEGGLAVGRCGKCFVALDICCFVNRFSHYHGGKNSPVIMWNNTAFLEDVGCPSYDSPLFPLCKRSDRHSSLLVDGEGDAHAFGLYGFDGFARLEFDQAWSKTADGAMSFGSALSSNVPAWKGVRWRRELSLESTRLKIHDHVEKTACKHNFTLILVLAPQVEAQQDGENWLLKHVNGESCKLTLRGQRPNAVELDSIENCRERNILMVRRLRLQFHERDELDTEMELAFYSAP